MIQNYVVKGSIGEGSYGVVHKAVDKRSGQIVALKFAREKDILKGYSTIKNEIETLRSLQHVNIIRLIDSATPSDDERNKKNIHQPILVLEHCICDLDHVMMSKLSLTAQVIKTIAKQIFESLKYLRECQIIHCDVKPSNILLSAEGQLKLCDFGLAMRSGSYGRKAGFNRRYSPPETLLGSTKFDYTVDMWSTGCIIAELYKGSCLYSEIETKSTLSKIFRLCGSFSKETWTDLVPYLPKKFKSKILKYRPGVLCSELKAFIDDPLARDMICKLMKTDPVARCTVRHVFSLPYMNCSPFALADLETIVKTMQNEDTNSKDS